MSTDQLVPLLAMVRAARAELGEGRPGASDRGAQLLRLAEQIAGELPSREVTDDRLFKSVTALRTELGTCLIAADRLEDAGVSLTLVTDVLRRGAMLAEQVLSEAVFGPVAVGS